MGGSGAQGYGYGADWDYLFVFPFVLFPLPPARMLGDWDCMDDGRDEELNWGIDG